MHNGFCFWDISFWPFDHKHYLCIVFIAIDSLPYAIKYLSTIVDIKKLIKNLLERKEPSKNESPTSFQFSGLISFSFRTS